MRPIDADKLINDLLDAGFYPAIVKRAIERQEPVCFDPYISDEDKKTIAALEHCIKIGDDCTKCPLFEECDSSKVHFHKFICTRALAMIKRHQSEVELVYKNVHDVAALGASCFWELLVGRFNVDGTKITVDALLDVGRELIERVREEFRGVYGENGTFNQN